MISTALTLPADKQQNTSAVGAAPLVLGLLGGFILGAAYHPIALILTVPLGLVVGGLGSVAVVASSPKQSHLVTLESDGVTLWAYHSRAPQEKPKARALFSVLVDQVAACESGNAQSLFGNVTYAGNALFPAFVWGSVGRNYKETAALYLRSSRGLLLLGASDISKAWLFDLVGQVNGFLADARALRAPPPDLGGAAPSTGFDV